MFLIESRETDDGTILYVFSRDENHEKHINIVKDFIPYFYVKESESIPDDSRIIKSESGFKSIDGSNLKKVYVKNSKNVPDLKKLFSKTYEADILFTNRYIIDEVGEIKPYKLRTLYVDIELNADDVFPDMEDPNQEVSCVSLTDDFTNKTITLFYQHPNAPVKLKEQPDVKIYHTEEELLLGLIAHIKYFDPDILSGWNSNSFDFTYLIRRMKKLNINYSGLSPLNKVYITPRGDVNIKGRVLLDGMLSYMHFRKISNQGKAESLSLEFTGQSELGIGKLPHEENFHDMWFNNPQKFVEYNRRDNELVKRIIEKNKIFDFFNQIRCKACSQLKDVFSASTLVDSALLYKEHNKVVFPNRNSSEGEYFSGAFVILPKPGLYEGVLVLDVKSMYPNIVKTFNVGYETLNKDGNIKLANNICFDSGSGIISRALMNFEKERNEQKRLMRAAKTDEERNFYYFRQYAIKVIMNSIYGFLGFPKSRLYKKEVAEAITTTGRELILWTKEKLEDKGYEVVYGDTDSVFLAAKTTSLPMMIIEGEKLIKYINDSYVEFAKERGSDNCTLEIEFEKVFKKILFVGKKDSDEGAKKKYAYILSWKDGKKLDEKVDVTGFETVRSDNPRVAREIQKKVIDMILTNKDRKDVMKYLLEMEKKIKNREIDDDMIGFPKGISNHLTEYKSISPVVRGCLYANKYLGTKFGKGSKPKWMFIKKVPRGYPKTDVISYEYEMPKGFEIDFSPMIERIFKMKLQALWKAAGWGEFPIIDSSIKTLDSWGV